MLAALAAAPTVALEAFAGPGHGHSENPNFDPQNEHSFREIVPKLRDCPEGSEEIERNELRVLCRAVGETDSTFEFYPTPEGIHTHIVHERDLPREINTRYPDWYRGMGEGYHADENAFHYYFDLLGEGLKYPGYDATNIYCASFYLRPGKTYFAHSHPTREFYYFFQGEGTWFGPGETLGEHRETQIGQGTFIVNPPYIHHGVRNDAKEGELGALACWWRNEDDPQGVFNNRGLPLNPCLVLDEETSEGYPDYREGVCAPGVPREES
ncbi:MAG: hypothetical protein F6J87_24425 [Spirulina sp. SIO3F2]|nr:hypothetical protein [Spirulina sp. SIO3F2]